MDGTEFVFPLEGSRLFEEMFSDIERISGLGCGTGTRSMSNCSMPCAEALLTTRNPVNRVVGTSDTITAIRNDVFRIVIWSVNHFIRINS